MVFVVAFLTLLLAPCVALMCRAIGRITLLSLYDIIGTVRIAGHA